MKDRYDTLEELKSAFPDGNEFAYAVGTVENNEIYIWSEDKNDWISLGALQGPQGPQGIQGEQGPQGPQGDPGPKGDPGSSIQKIERTSGTGAPGTTDTYTITLTDGRTSTFTVYNGANGEDAGDFMANGSVPMTGTLNMGGNAVQNLAGPTNGTDAANKNYVDSGLQKKQDALTGVSGQVVGFGEDGSPIAQSLDIPKAETYSFGVAATSWQEFGSEYVVERENSFVSAEGYVYLLSLNAGYNTYEYQFDLVVEEGVFYIYCSGKPSRLLRFVLTRVPVEGNSVSIVTVGVPPKKEEESAFNTGIFSSIVSKFIPAGRVVGDVDGDGYITNNDANLILSYTSGNETLDETQLACADANGDGTVNSMDNLTVQQITSGSVKLGEISRDITGVWTVNPNYATEDGQFYVDVTDPEASTTSDFVILLQGDEVKKVTKVVPHDGSFRVYMTVPPIVPMPYKIIT